MSLDAWVGDQEGRLPRLTVLGRSLRGVLSWNVHDACNYRCSYCTQRFAPDRSFVLQDVEQALRGLAGLSGAWEIKLSGGEPMLVPRLPELAAALVGRGHVLSIQTNFSASDRMLQDFLAATRGALHTFSASLHLDQAAPEQLVERYRRLVQPYEQHGLRFHVTSVATAARLPELHGRIAPFLRAAGITFKVQPEKDHGVVRPYSAAERTLLLQLGGHNLTGQIAPCFTGRLCHAGFRYLVIKSDGRAFRCYAASRSGGRHARLGSLQQGLVLLGGPRLCPYPYCVCTVPIQRGMIEGAAGGAHGEGEG